MNAMTGSRAVASVLAGLLLTGCAKVRYPANYVLTFPPPAPKAASTPAGFGSVSVQRFRCAEYVCQGRVVYRPIPEQVGFYEYHRWATDPRDLITTYVIDSLRNENFYKHVERGVPSGYILSGSVDRLEELDEPGHVRVICALSAQLVDAQTGAILWQGAASETIAVEERNVAGVVRSLSSATQAAVDQLMRSMRQHAVSARANNYPTEE